jgi:uncharacterized protein
VRDAGAAFDRVCAQLGGFDERLGAERIDGYLSALVCGPRAVSPTEWLPKLAGDAFERAFADPDDVQRALDALMQRYDEIAVELLPERLDADPDRLRLNPMLQSLDADGRAERWSGALWSDGFLQAVRDFDWQVPERAHEVDRAHYDACLQAIGTLSLDDEPLGERLRVMFPGQTPDRDTLIDEACFAAQDLRLFWLDHTPKPPPLRVPKAPGRNDPCPCGSGKKYKKCCGAAPGG